MFKKSALKKYLTGLMGLLIIVSVMGCTTILIKAPPGKNIQLANATSAMDFNKSKRIWYVLWGLVPLGDNTTDDLLASVPDNSKVSVKTELSPIDFLISALLGGISIQTRTVSVAISPEK